MMKDEMLGRTINFKVICKKKTNGNQMLSSLPMIYAYVETFIWSQNIMWETMP